MNVLRTWLLALSLFIGGQAAVFSQPTPDVAMPPLPKSRSPVEYFRKLLAATPAERDEMLKDRNEAQRQVINAKINEYIILPPPIREWRLKATELRWYLLPLMQRVPGERDALLTMIPDDDRSLVELRLQQWDRLPAREREEMLNSQIALGYLARPTKVPVRTEQLQSDPRLAQLEASVTGWQRLPAAEQELITKQFNSFFSLSTAEKQKTIALFSGAEHAQLQKTVRSFEGMSEDNRRKCVAAMQQIARMSGDERGAFLKNAERWKSLSDQERRQWRTLVTKVPPLPPGFVPPNPPGFPKPGADTNSL
jgi:hypothetical protein